MNIAQTFNPKKTPKLIGMEKHFEFLKFLIVNDKLPKVSLLSGEKGIGKSTLVNHLMYFYFDKNNYDSKKYSITQESVFYKQYLKNFFPNTIYLEGSALINIKVDDIRLLKEKILKSSMNDTKRFIILDDVETFNINSLNALLKIIEEPSSKNYFILINNKTKPLLETIKSRCLETKVIVNNETKLKILSYLVDFYNQELVLDSKTFNLSPGNLIKFNFIFSKHNIDMNKSFLDNLKTLMNIYKKEKDIFYKDLLIFFTEYYIDRLKKDDLSNYEKFINNRMFIIKIINNFFKYKLNQNTLINSIDHKLNNE